jgi:2-oxoglutarate ferredoxin oxidoreductase subunit alpha
MNPLPKNLGDIMSKFKTILVPEINRGQLKFILQSKFLREIESLNKMQGIPFKSSEIEEKVLELLNKGGK